MKKYYTYIFVILIGAGITACSSFSPTSWQGLTYSVDESPDEPSPLDSIITPYSQDMHEEMTNVIGRSREVLEKGRPCGWLNNWTADAVMTNQLEALGTDKNFMVLLNVGGLRSNINQGEITVGDIYELMPFDNEIVWVQMPMSSLTEIGQYLKSSGGEPIANARFENGNLKLNILNPNDNTFWILTSDYLMNGGDKMNFFSKKLDVVFTGKLLRDAFMEEIRREFTISIDKTCRINVD